MKLLVSDLHLTDSPNETYRWKIFDEIRNQLEKRDITEIIFLGDLTDKKDKHSSWLVNRIVEEIILTSTLYAPVTMYFLKGNHDYIDEKNPFFAFLSKLEGVCFISKPTMFGNNFFIPHIHNPTKEYFIDLIKNGVDADSYVFLHQPFLGAKINEKYELENCIDAIDIFKELKGRVFSGDIHIPQVLGNITYVGAPYPLHYGDEYEGRFILIEPLTKGFITTNIPIHSIKKHFITLSVAPYSLEGYKISPEDHCAIKLKLPKESLAFIDVIKAVIVQQLKICGVEVYQIDVEKLKEEKFEITSIATKSKSPKEIYLEFCKKEKLTLDYQEYGLEVLC